MKNNREKWVTGTTGGQRRERKISVEVERIRDGQTQLHVWPFTRLAEIPVGF